MIIFSVISRAHSDEHFNVWYYDRIDTALKFHIRLSKEARCRADLSYTWPLNAEVHDLAPTSSITSMRIIILDTGTYKQAPQQYLDSLSYINDGESKVKLVCLFVRNEDSKVCTSD